MILSACFISVEGVDRDTYFPAIRFLVDAIRMCIRGFAFQSNCQLNSEISERQDMAKSGLQAIGLIAQLCLEQNHYRT